jgi:IS5 family transposase
MREILQQQLLLQPALPEHLHLKELEEMSKVLDANPQSAALVHADLTRGLRATTGNIGLRGDQVMRAAILYHSKNWSFETLAFELRYHAAYRWFCRLDDGTFPSKSSLHRDIQRITPDTWEAINRLVVGYAQILEIEDGKRVRTDCTVVSTNIHAPTDSSLLWDCVRVLTRELKNAEKLISVAYSDHTKKAKRRAWAIRNAKRKTQRLALYRELVAVAKESIADSRRCVQTLRLSKQVLAAAIADSMQDTIELALKVVDQTARRVFHGESVQANEKVVSIFEAHTDVIRKGGRDTYYGHKICVSTGSSNLITNCMILDGNPRDSDLAVDMMKRHDELFSQPPQQAAFDGGFATKDNLTALKAMKIKDVMFSKRVGLAISDMVKDSWVYKQLRDFRAGIEGVISFLKRAFGLRRCRFVGKRSFHAYVHGSILAANLLILARHNLS